MVLGKNDKMRLSTAGTMMCFMAMMLPQKPSASIKKKTKRKKSSGAKDAADGVVSVGRTFECKFKSSPSKPQAGPVDVERERVEAEFQVASHLKLSDFVQFAAFSKRSGSAVFCFGFLATYQSFFDDILGIKNRFLV